MKAHPVISGRAQPPLRILIVTDSLQVGGGERHVVELAVALRRKGYDAVVACSQDGSLRRVLDEARVPVHVLMDHLVKRRLSLAYAHKLRRVVHQGRFDLVHAHVYASAVAATIATLGTGVPVVITEHSEAAWRGWRARMVARWMHRRAARIIAVSEPIRKRLIAMDGAPADRVSVISNAVPPAAACAAPAPRTRLEDGPLIGVVARLQPEKGVCHFLEAAVAVAAAFPGSRFLVIGDGPLRADLERRAQDLGLEDRVHFLGFQQDARSLMERLDILVIPSISEGAPLVALEAMCAGIPLVATRVGGIPDQIRHGHEGLLVPPGDAAALADACMTLLGDPEYALQLGEAGQTRVAMRFSHAGMVRQIEGLYRQALGRTPAVVTRPKTALT